MAEQRNTNNITLANMQDATPEGKYRTMVFPNLPKIHNLVNTHDVH